MSSPRELEVTQDHLPGGSESNSETTNLIAGYEILDEIAHGGMGLVLNARDMAFDRDVAIKVLLPEARNYPEAVARFAIEARITGRLQHPGIPPVHQLGKLSDGSPFLAMKLIRGRTLAELLKKRATPAEELTRFIQVFEQICQAVGFAHASEIIHRDLKPANIMVGAFGEVQVMDWGLAKEMRNETASARTTATRSLRGQARDAIETEPFAEELDETAAPTPFTAETTQPGTVLGTIPYMPPEQAKGLTDQIDSRSDVFSLGAVLCTILTGKPPYQGLPVATLLVLAEMCDTSDAIRRLDACGADLELITICKQCLSKSRGDRPADGGAVATLVAAYRLNVQERLQQAERDQAATAARLAEERKRRRVRQIAFTLAGLLALGAVGFAFWSERQQRKQEQAELATVQAEAREAQTAADLKVRDAEAKSFDEMQRLKTEQARLNVLASLPLAQSLRTQYKFEAADQALTGAEKLIAGGGLDDLGNAVARARADLEFVRDLDRIRMQRLTWVLGPDGKGKMNTASAPPAYRVAFASRGFEFHHHDPNALADRLKNSPIKKQIIAAIDDWAFNPTETDVALIERLLTVARLADPDPWNDRFRNIDIRANHEQLFWLSTQALRREIAPESLATLSEIMAEAHLDPTRMLNAALIQSPTSFPVALALGEWYIHERDGARAAAAFQTALSLRPDDPYLLANLGFAYTAQNRNEDALAAFERSALLQPGDPLMQANLGAVRCFHKDWAGGVAALEKSIALDPEMHTSRLYLGRALGKTGQNQKALEVLENVIRSGPTNGEAYLEKGIVLLSLERLDEAKITLKEAVRLLPNSSRALTALGEALEKTGDAAGALIQYRKAVQFDPADGYAWNSLGSALKEQGDLPGAIEAYRRALSLEPSLAAAHTNLGLALKDQKQFAAAVEHCRKATVLEPREVKMWHNLGVTLNAAGELRDAASAYREAVHIDPGFSASWVNLGLILFELRELPEAEKVFIEVLRLRPNDALAHLFMGMILRDQGRFRTAVKFFERGNELGQELPDWKWPSEQWLSQCRQLASLETSLEAVLAGDLEFDEASDYLNYAMICLKYKQQYADAVHLYRKALAADATLPSMEKTVRLNAARAAIQASAGRGVDPPALADRAGFRNVALTWLRAELTMRKRTFERRNSEGPDVHQEMLLWLNDSLFVPVRHPFFLSTLTPEEREVWGEFWNEVRKLRDRTAPS